MAFVVMLLDLISSWCVFIVEKANTLQHLIKSYQSPAGTLPMKTAEKCTHTLRPQMKVVGRMYSTMLEKTVCSRKEPVANQLSSI